MGRLFITAEFKDKDGATVQKAFKEEEKHFLNTNTGVYTNVGLAYMGFMKKDFYFIKGDLNTKGYYGFNKMELKIVRFLYKIRNANKYKEHPILKTSTISEMVFSMSLTGQRIFIAGRIIPQILIKIYGFNDVDCNTTKIEIKSKWSGLKLYDGFYPKGWGDYYLNINNGRIKIFFPDAENEQNRNILFNFLTNSPTLTFVVEHGEFPDMETYELATAKKTMVKEEACWLESDRTANNQIWKNACKYIIKNQVSGILAPFGQIANFYDYVEIRLKAFGHEVRWTRGARALVHMLADGKWKIHLGGSLERC